ncbi:MAG: hypothetical protein RMK98_05985 [Bacteroidia bacterium]|nr:hypothetical protein [Bacteroidia bacterium]
MWRSVLYLIGGYFLSAQSLLSTADSLLIRGRCAPALALYDSVLRTQLVPDTVRLRIYLKGAEAWGEVNKPTEALRWIARRDAGATAGGYPWGLRSCWAGKGCTIFSAGRMRRRRRPFSGLLG